MAKRLAGEREEGKDKKAQAAKKRREKKGKSQPNGDLESFLMWPLILLIVVVSRGTSPGMKEVSSRLVLGVHCPAQWRYKFALPLALRGLDLTSRGPEMANFVACCLSWELLLYWGMMPTLRYIACVGVSARVGVYCPRETVRGSCGPA